MSKRVRALKDSTGELHIGIKPMAQWEEASWLIGTGDYSVIQLDGKVFRTEHVIYVTILEVE